MELKRAPLAFVVDGSVHLLIEPYGIETTWICPLMLPCMTLLIEPYGIETCESRSKSRTEADF